jgi:hypothetical protein
LTLVSEGKDLRRLLVISKGWEVEKIRVPGHGTYSLKVAAACGPRNPPLKPHWWLSNHRFATPVGALALDLTARGGVRRKRHWPMVKATNNVCLAKKDPP